MQPGRRTCSQNVLAKADVVFPYAHNALCEGCAGRRGGRGEGGAPGRHFSHPRRARRNTLAWLQLVESVRRKRTTPNVLSSRQEVVVNLRMS